MKVAEKYAAEHKKRREEIEAKNEAENLCYAAEKLVNENGDKISEEDKNAVNQKVAALKEAINQNNADMMKTGKDELQKTVYEVSSKLYQQAAPQGGQPGANPDPNAPQGNVYDADYKDVDGDNK